MRSRRVTMGMLADHVGLDRTTVSRILNKDTTSHKYAAETVRRVEEAAKTLGYRRNIPAVTLKTGRSLTLALVVADISRALFSQMAFRLDRLCHEAGYRLIICNSEEDPRIERDIFRSLGDRSVDGAIVSPARMSLAHLREAKAHVGEIVLFDRVTPSLAEFPSVTVDNVGGARAAVERLLVLGHRDIGVLAGRKANPALRDRIRGCREAYADRDLNLNPRRIVTGCTNEAKARRMARLLLTESPRPSAVFAPNSHCAIAVLRVARELKLRVPSDLSVVGFHVPMRDLLNPPLDAVLLPGPELAREASRILMARLEASGPLAPERVVLPVEFSIGGSSAPPRGHG